MLKILAVTALVAAVAVAAVLVYATTRPDTFRVQRTASINAAPDKIFPLLSDLRAHGAWSPWEKKDPGMKRSFSGAESGKGAVYEWDGNNQIGTGRLEITDVAPYSKIVMKLDFLKPFEAHNIAEFTLAPNGAATEVTWAMHGPNPYFAKLMQIFFSMDKMVGREFETGLGDLKALVEK